MSALERVPGLAGYLAAQKERDRRDATELEQVQAVQGLVAQLRARQQDEMLRADLAASGGDLQKALSASIARGNLAGAHQLAPVIEATRKANAPRVVAPGSQVLGPNNEVLHQAPFAPQRPQASPEIINLMAMRDSLPEGHPARAELQGRIAHLSGGGAAAERSPFGTGATGGALDIMTRYARGYGAGATNDTEDREFEAAITHYTQPRLIPNPDTGLMERQQPQLPPFVQEAINQRRGARAAPQPSPQPTTDPATPPGAPTPQPRPSLRAQTNPKTVWELSSLVTGPVPAGAEFLSRTPLLGEIVKTPGFTQARTYVEQLNRDLIRALQNNPRYSEGERKAIEKEISIDGKLFDHPSAYRNRLIGIADALRVRERNASETANSTRVGKEERIHALNVSNAIRQHLIQLGVPPRITGNESYDELPDEFIDPEGQIRRKPK
jgi:hypothetical protein